MISDPTHPITLIGNMVGESECFIVVFVQPEGKFSGEMRDSSTTTIDCVKEASDITMEVKPFKMGNEKKLMCQIKVRNRLRSTINLREPAEKEKKE